MGSAQRSAPLPPASGRLREASADVALKSWRAAADPLARDAVSHPADHRSTRRVTLPTGQDVDVLSIEGGSAPGACGAPATTSETGLHVCPECTSRLVVPVAWDQAGPREWAVTIQCPNCEWWDADVFDEAPVERFDEELDRGTEALVRDLLRLVRANMEEDVERFVAALRAGAILPEDF